MMKINSPWNSKIKETFHFHYKIMNDEGWIYASKWANTKRRRSSRIHERIATEAKKIKTQVPYGKYKSFIPYSKTILKSSLITGWPQIASTKNWFKKVIKILVFLLCVLGFVYQTVDFLVLYMSYQTSVNVFVSSPSEILPPAITVCNRNRRRRSVVCSNDPAICSPVYNICSAYPRFCPDLNPAKAYSNMVYPFVLLGAEDFDWGTSYEEAHLENVKTCKLSVDRKLTPCTFKNMYVPVVDMKGEPNYCQVIQSLWEKPNEELQYYPNTFTYEIELDAVPEEYLRYTEKVKMQVGVHDRRSLLNPFLEGVALDGGKHYMCHVSMTETKLLPPPYDTQCTDYLAEWKKNNGTGPLNERSCIELCKLETVMAKGSCIDKHVSYPHEYDLCPKDEITTTSDIIRNCTESCKNACEDRTYQVQYEETRDLTEYCAEDNENCKKRTISITVSFKKFLLTSYIYEPKFESVELYSYIGGYMGMWLGLSLVSLFDLLDTMCHLLYYPLGRLLMKHKRMKTTSFDVYGQKAWNGFY